MIRLSVPRVVTKIMLPFVALFAFYVQFHGDFGPGGGFQAGVILATVMTLYLLLFGITAARRVAPPHVLQAMAACGVLLFAGTGVVAWLRGGYYLDYDALAANPLDGQHLGLVLIELGVGLTVSAVIVSILFAFAGREVPRHSE